MNSKVMILGLGSVGRSLMDLLISEKLFSSEDIMAIDCSEDAFKYFTLAGGKKENFMLYETNSSNYQKIFEHLKSGDFLFCLADGNDSLILANESLKRNIHFFSASDDQFDDLYEKNTVLYRDHFLAYKELSKESKGKATGILQFGVNPGLVSVLTKTALKYVVEKDEGAFVIKKRDYFKKLIAEEKWPLLAKELMVSSFIESDFDFTESDLDEESDTVYCTWNVFDFNEEMNDRSTVKVGTQTPLTKVLERLGSTPDQIYYYNAKDGTLVLNALGKTVKTPAFSQGKVFEGCVDAHEEVFSIHDYYCIKDKEGEIVYAPTMMFVYRPCELALSSVFHKDNKKFRLITNEHIRSGGEAVGICVEGKNFRPVHVETALTYDNKRKESPSVLLVSVSLVAAIRYAINHPNEGLLFPEYTEPNEIISYISKYMQLEITKL